MGSVCVCAARRGKASKPLLSPATRLMWPCSVCALWDPLPRVSSVALASVSQSHTQSLTPPSSSRQSGPSLSVPPCPALPWRTLSTHPLTITSLLLDPFSSYLSIPTIPLAPLLPYTRCLPPFACPRRLLVTNSVGASLLNLAASNSPSIYRPHATAHSPTRSLAHPLASIYAYSY